MHHGGGPLQHVRQKQLLPAWITEVRELYTPYTRRLFSLLTSVCGIAAAYFYRLSSQVGFLSHKYRVSHQGHPSGQGGDHNNEKVVCTPECDSKTLLCVPFQLGIKTPRSHKETYFLVFGFGVTPHGRSNSIFPVADGYSHNKAARKSMT